MARRRLVPVRDITAETPLTDTERAFVDEYLVDENGLRAYRAAFGEGGTYQTAAKGACQLVKQPNVAAELRAARASQSVRTQIRADHVLREIARIAFSDIIDLYDPATGNLRTPRQIPLATRRVVKSIKVRRETVRVDVTNAYRHPGPGRPAADTTTVTTVRETEIEYQMWDKLGGLEKLCRHLGLNTEITPLESLLSAIQAAAPALAAEVRAALAAPRTAAPSANGTHSATAGR